jgi:hypothetical protein
MEHAQQIAVIAACAVIVLVGVWHIADWSYSDGYQDAIDEMEADGEHNE